MTVFEVPNIEHVTVTAVGSPAVAYRLNAHDGWWLHLNDDVEDTVNLYKKAMVLMVNRDWSQLEVVAEADLPEGAETADAPKNESEDKTDG